MFPNLPKTGLSVLVMALAVLLPPTRSLAEAEDTGGGISYGEYVRTFPAMPAAVRVDLDNGKPLICWEAPDHPPPGELAYDPVIAGYRVYSLAGTGRQVRLGETATTCFHDTEAPSGTIRRYAVTAVQRSGQESDPTQAVTIRVP
ncbi:hypothetical protein [Microbaculum marinum]|uniref:Fibronectin type-III domain-containing protein n=1 Tax=Microbaculum marinum TaxID=1764581 RepID=A0AAW9RVZ8_9HYPH